MDTRYALASSDEELDAQGPPPDREDTIHDQNGPHDLYRDSSPIAIELEHGDASASEGGRYALASSDEELDAQGPLPEGEDTIHDQNRPNDPDGASSPTAIELEHEDPSASEGDKKEDGCDPSSGPVRLPLQRHGPWGVYLFSEVLYIALSVFFLVAGFVFLSLNGQERSERSERVVQFSSIMPTVWPIAFAAILGNSIKWYTYWRLEHSIELQSLDRLMTSQTLGSSIVTIFTHRSMTPITVLLMAIWLFSPLGSQAFLRVLSTEIPTAINEGNVSYVDPGPPEFWDDVGPFCCASGFNEDLKTTSALYSANVFRPDIGTQYNSGDLEQYNRIILSLGGPQRAAQDLAVDAWGNIRIPAIHHLAGYKEGLSDWIDIPQDSGVLNYSSLIGFIYRGIPSDFEGNTSMLVNQSYHKFSCSPWHIEVHESFKEQSDWLDQRRDQFRLNPPAKNKTTWLDIMSQAGHGLGSFFVDSPDGSRYHDLPTNNNSKLPEVPERRFWFGSRAEIDNNQTPRETTHVLSFSTCTVKMEYIQARVFCQSFGLTNKRNCRVEGMRANPDPPFHSSYTAFDQLNFPDAFAQGWPKALDSGPVGEAITITESFLLNPGATRLGNGDHVRWYLPVLSNLSITEFEDRVTLLANTFIRASVRYSSTVGTLEDLFNETVSAEALEAGTHRINPEMTFFLPPRYVVSTLWMVIYFASSTVMLLGAIAAFVLRLWCRAPEILSFVSSTTRDSEYFKDLTADENSTRVGPDISKQLRRTQVMVGDVKPEGEAGKIALVPAGMAKGIEKTRLYM